MILSFDIETAGISQQTADGRPIPPTHHFHPRRVVFQDKVEPRDLLLTAATTVIEKEGEWFENLDKARPGVTIGYRLWVPEERRLLAYNLRKAHTLVGHNILYDLVWARSQPDFLRVLCGAHRIIDTGILNFLDNELRPERSLKDLGQLFNLFSYEGEPTADRGFATATDPNLLLYNCRDAHRTTLLMAQLAREILANHPLASRLKLSERTLGFYSNLIWSFVRLSESGIPFSLSRLREALARATATYKDRASTLAASYNLLLDGKGSPASRTAFMQRCFDYIDANVPVPALPTVYAHPLLEHTTTGALSASSQNRALATVLLPCDTPEAEALTLWNEASYARTLTSRYFKPLLADPHDPDSTSALVPYPRNRDIALAFPSWYLTPSPIKDTSGKIGGQKQVRPSAQNPGIQQAPDEVFSCIRSRYGDNGCIIAMDLSQVELRVAALLSGDDSLVAAYNDPTIDLHSNRAIEIFGYDYLVEACGLPLTKANKAFNVYRQVGKTFNFADLYGAGALKLWAIILRDAGRIFPLKTIANAVADRARLRPGLVAWQRTILKFAAEHGRLYLPILGISRHFTISLNDRSEKDDRNEALNFPVQGFAAAVMLEVQSYVHRALGSFDRPSTDRVHPFANIYDSLVADVHNSARSPYRTILQDAITYTTTNGLWAEAQRHYNRVVPLDYEIKEAA